MSFIAFAACVRGFELLLGLVDIKILDTLMSFIAPLENAVLNFCRILFGIIKRRVDIILVDICV